MKKSEIFFGILRMPFDALAVWSAILLSYKLRFLNIDLIPRVQLLEPATTLPSLDHFVATFVIPSIVVFIAMATIVKLYSLRMVISSWNEMGRIIVAVLLWLSLIVGWYFFIERQLFYSRILLGHSLFFMIIFTALGRIVVIYIQRLCLARGIGVRNVLSVGDTEPSSNLKEYLQQDLRYSYLGHTANLDQVKKKIAHNKIDMLFQTDVSMHSDNTNSLIDYCRNRHIGYALLPPVLSNIPHMLRIDHMGLTPIIRFEPTPLDGWGRVIKRAFDFFGSMLFLVVLSPFLLLIAVCIVVENGFPVFYISRRMGIYGESEFPVIKFRSMVRGADRMKKELLQQNERTDGPLFKLKNDPRITRVGRVIRRYDLDELPQLFNVVAGQMSLVGPRPHLPSEVEKYTQYQRRVFAIAPGMTGLAQVSGRSDLPFQDEVRYDLQYIEEWSVWLDLWIMWRTIFAMLRKKDF